MERAERKKLFEGIAAKDFSELKAKRDAVKQKRLQEESDRDDLRKKQEDELLSKKPEYTAEILIRDILPFLERAYAAAETNYPLRTGQRGSGYLCDTFGDNRDNIWYNMVAWLSEVWRFNTVRAQSEALKQFNFFLEDIDDMWTSHYPNMRTLYHYYSPKEFTFNEK